MLTGSVFTTSSAFGGFVGLASSYVLYFKSEFGLSPVHAGDLAAICTATGALLRPVGGAIADRIGGDPFPLPILRRRSHRADRGGFRPQPLPQYDGAGGGFGSSRNGEWLGLSTFAPTIRPGYRCH